MIDKNVEEHQQRIESLFNELAEEKQVLEYLSASLPADLIFSMIKSGDEWRVEITTPYSFTNVLACLPPLNVKLTYDGGSFILTDEPATGKERFLPFKLNGSTVSWLHRTDDGTVFQVTTPVGGLAVPKGYEMWRGHHNWAMTRKLKWPETSPCPEVRGQKPLKELAEIQDSLTEFEQKFMGSMANDILTRGSASYLAGEALSYWVQQQTRHRVKIALSPINTQPFNGDCRNVRCSLQLFGWFEFFTLKVPTGAYAPSGFDWFYPPFYEFEEEREEGVFSSLY